LPLIFIFTTDKNSSVASPANSENAPRDSRKVHTAA